jgi:hypothetical protein
LRIAAGGLGLVAAVLAMALAGCRDSEGPEFEIEVLEYITVLPSTVLQLVNNGSMTNPDFSPYEYPRDYFCFVESPGMLDSVFCGDHSSLDSLFPDGGSLLVLEVTTCVEDELLGYSVDYSGDTVTVSVEINEWIGPGVELPGIDNFVFPFGVVLQSAAQPEATGSD